jgi:hypothetical protein
MCGIDSLKGAVKIQSDIGTVNNCYAECPDEAGQGNLGQVFRHAIPANQAESARSQATVST